jgi:hypothetical protein
MDILQPRNLIAAGGAFAVFVGGLALPIHSVVLDLAVSGALAAAAGVGLRMVMPQGEAIQLPRSGASPVDHSRLISEIAQGSGVPQEEVIAAIQMGQDKLRQIRSHAAEIRNPNVANRIRSILLIGDKIIEDFKQDPRDVRLARQWLNSYLDQAIDVVRDYARLSRNAAGQADVQHQLSKFGETLDDLDTLFKKQLEALLSNDAVNFEVNNKVFRDTLKEGL